MIEMAVEMVSDTRKRAKSGVYPPVEGFDAVGRRHIGRPSDRATYRGRSGLQPTAWWHPLRRRKPLKVAARLVRRTRANKAGLPAALLLASAHMRSDHVTQINGS